MFVNRCVERDELGGGRNRDVIGLRPVAYPDAADAGRLKRIASAWLASGISARPHVVTASQMMVSVGDDGLRRIHPTRETDRYMEIGTPYVKVAGVWRKVGFTSATRTANSITWHRTQADLRITHGGHFIKLDLELLGGYVPEGNLIAFPVGLTGLTRKGGQILADGAPVALLRAPVVTDASNPEDVRPIAWEFTSLAGQPYLVLTLPSLAGMARPVVDPTLTLQPDAAVGEDAWLYKYSPNGNAATTDYFYIVQQEHTNGTTCLVRFDLSSIPAGSTIDSANLSLFVKVKSAYSSSSPTFHRVLAANSGWTEGGATWNYAVGTTRWAGDIGSDGGEDAGCSVHATDIGNTSMGLYTTNSSTDALGTEKDVSLDVAEFTALWGANYGIQFHGHNNDGGHRICTSDHATAGYRPKLVVEYTAAAAGNPWYAYAQM